MVIQVRLSSNRISIATETKGEVWNDKTWMRTWRSGCSLGVKKKEGDFRFCPLPDILSLWHWIDDLITHIDGVGAIICLSSQTKSTSCHWLTGSSGQIGSSPTVWGHFRGSLCRAPFLLWLSTGFFTVLVLVLNEAQAPWPSSWALAPCQCYAALWLHSLSKTRFSTLCRNIHNL